MKGFSCLYYHLHLCNFNVLVRIFNALSYIMFGDDFEDNAHQITCSKMLICSCSLMVSSENFRFCGATAAWLFGTSGGLCSSLSLWWSSTISVRGWWGSLFLWSRVFDCEFGWNILKQTLELWTPENYKQFKVIRVYDEQSLNTNRQMQVEICLLSVQLASCIHAASVQCTLRTLSLWRGKTSRSIELTNHLHLVMKFKNACSFTSVPKTLCLGIGEIIFPIFKEENISKKSEQWLMVISFMTLHN